MTLSGLPEDYVLPTLFDLYVKILAISMRCPNGCRSCLSDATLAGEYMPAERIAQLRKRGLPFMDNRVILSFGEPFFYFHDGNDLGDIAKLLTQTAVSYVSIITGGFDEKKHPWIEQTLRKLAWLGNSVGVQVSFNLHRGPKSYEKTFYTVDRLMAHGIKPKYFLAHYNRGEEQETLERLKQLRDYFGLGDVGLEQSETSPAGRALKNRLAMEEPLRPGGLDFCDAVGVHPQDKMREVGILANGDVTPCAKNFCSWVRPVGNIFTDSPAELQRKYRGYVMEMLRLTKSKPNDRLICFAHMAACAGK